MTKSLSLIGQADTDPELVRKWRLEDETEARKLRILKLLLFSLADGELTFTSFAQHAKRIVRDLAPGPRQRLLGAAFDAALNVRTPPRSRGRRRVTPIMKIAVGLAVLAIKDGVPVARTSGTSSGAAFELSAKLLAKEGIQVSASGIEREYYKPRKAVRRK